MYISFSQDKFYFHEVYIPAMNILFPPRRFISTDGILFSQGMIFSARRIFHHKETAVMPLLSLKCESMPRQVNAFAPGRDRSYKAKTKMSTLSSCSTSNTN